MFNLRQFLALLLSTLVVLTLFQQGYSSPLPQAPDHAGPTQFGSEHLGPQNNQHAGPPSGGFPSRDHAHDHGHGHGHGHGQGVGSALEGPVDIALYGN